MVACAFRLHNLIQSKHQFSRGLDANTRLQIDLIVASAITPPSPSLAKPSSALGASSSLVKFNVSSSKPSSSSAQDSYTKADLSNDLEYLARAIVDQALRPQVTLAQITKTMEDTVKRTVTGAVKEAILDLPMPLNAQEITSALVGKFTPDISHSGSTQELEAACPGCHQMNKNCRRWRELNPSRYFYWSVGRLTSLKFRPQVNTTGKSMIGLMNQLASASFQSVTFFYCQHCDSLP